MDNTRAGLGQVRGRAAVADASIEHRIGSKIKPQPNGCWLYNGQVNAYHAVKIEGSMVRAHRYVYETLVGPIPEGLDLHHTCLTKACCNPAHLEPMTEGDHMRLHAELRRQAS